MVDRSMLEWAYRQGVDHAHLCRRVRDLERIVHLGEQLRKAAERHHDLSTRLGVEWRDKDDAAADLLAAIQAYPAASALPDDGKPGTVIVDEVQDMAADSTPAPVYQPDEVHSEGPAEGSDDDPIPF